MLSTFLMLNARTNELIARTLAVFQARSADKALIKKKELFKVIENIQTELFEVQSAYTALSADKDDLEQQYENLKAWAEDCSNYEKYVLPAGSYVYRYKSASNEAANESYLCPHCYENHTKSGLQSAQTVNWYWMLKCHTCHVSIRAAFHAAMGNAG